jgi:hypothetical protein
MVRVRRAPERLVRTNVDGRRVPAVLGDALAAGAVTGLGMLTVAWVAGMEVPRASRMTLAVGLIVVILWGAGRWDDLRGDERARGFKGHLGAARGGALTGGLVKLMAGGLVGLAAGALLTPGWSALATGMIVALTANLVNLLDRAPGRAGKIAALIALPLLLFGTRAWTVAAAGLLGALVACLPFDLRARGMLGDAGANPLGGVLGLGLAVALEGWGRVAAVVVLALLNGLSERVSFSRVIERTPVLRTLDLLGRGEGKGRN